MYKNLSIWKWHPATYNTKDLYTALKRMEMCASFFTMIPGPKMIWEFGELGYDYSINHCTNGTVNNAVVLIPNRSWDYMQNISRQRLYDIYSAFIKTSFSSFI
jgi:hypothetical protein